MAKGDGKVYNIPRTDLPLGPLSISAYLKKFLSLDVKLIDFNAEVNALDAVPFDCFEALCRHFFQQIRDFQPDFVGISSLFSPSFPNFMDCGRVAKEVWPDSIVVGGGNIPTNSYEQIYRDMGCTFFDGLCFGEGEKPMLHLLESDDPRAFLASSDTWITRGKVMGEELFAPKHDFIDDLDEIPFFDYDLCDIDKHEINQVVASYHNLDKTRGFHVMTSRGCPFLCTFCASHRTHGRSMRYHSLERVREDFTRLVEKYNAATVIFQDDHLMADSDRVYKILDIVKSLKLHSVYQNGLTLYALDRPMLEAFWDAGVRHLVLPVESGSEKVLKKQMRKPLKMKISERVAKDCRELGIYTNTNILIGMPGETKADLEDARRNLREIASNWFNIACASPIVGSEIHEISKAKGYIKINDLGSDYRTAVINTEDFSAEFIQEYQYFMNLDLNFVHNYDLRCGNYAWAERGLKNVLRLKSDHAFAHYYLAQCYRGLGQAELADQHYASYLKSIKTPFWGRWAWIFGLEGINPDDWSDADYGLLADILHPPAMTETDDSRIIAASA
ncbi:B12-binding domain-containing radical SAM protein [Chromobacterium violaceum]|nr:B12-binding domain-containing radical SAM protein [Chromobacterium violaceum]OQS46888.1 B12-binding domain-containing radical SAM protein [Chromobacterium violaceum]QRO35407.1 radical SAM protein [Chromobacterium violaceum]QRQ19132.1 radical SAM protein [Chromobacterium violaceum]